MLNAMEPGVGESFEEPIELTNQFQKQKYEEELALKQKYYKINGKKHKKKRKKLPVDMLNDVITNNNVTEEPTSDNNFKKITCISHIKFDNDVNDENEKEQSTICITKITPELKNANFKSFKTSAQEFIKRNLYGDTVKRTNPINNIKKVGKLIYHR